MARIELPESRLRSRKRRRRVRISLLLGALVVVVALAFIGAAQLSTIQIKSVAVSGAETLSSTTLQAFVEERLDGSYFWLFPKRNIFLYPKREIREALIAHYPSLASADVHAQDFQTLSVGVVEREPRALWCPTEGACYFMDENGVVYSEAPVFSEPVYTAYTGALSGASLPKQFLTAGEFQTLSALVDAIAQKLPDESVTLVAIDAEQDVRIRFASGFTLIFSQGDEGGDIFERFTLALTAEPMVSHKLSEVEYLDLRFGDKLYYKLR